MLLPTAMESAALPPTTNLYITGFVGAEINVTDLDGNDLMRVLAPGYYSKYLVPGTEVLISWTVNQDISYYVQIDGQRYPTTETTLRATIPPHDQVYDFELVKIDNSFDENDDDKDGLSNGLEDILGTDKNNPDTDGDGLSDYEESYSSLTDPRLVDTNKNGINDGNEDFDNDHLNNIEECLYGTNPYVADTDGDGINDFDEINEYFSNPLWIDTDNDGLSDGLENVYKMNPTNPDTLGDGIKDGKRKFNISLGNDQAFTEYGVRPTIEVELEGTQINSLSIDKIPDNDQFLSKEVPGFIGNAFDFSIDGNFSKATMIFEFPSILLNDQEFQPAIYYFDEEEQLLIELEDQVVTGNKISASVEHFSSYILLNKRIYSKVWEYEFLFDENPSETFENLDIAFVIDSSGSMTSNDPYGVRKTVTNNFIDKLTANDRVAIIDFDSTVKLLSSFTSNKTALKTAVGKIDSSGGTDLGIGISKAIDQFTATGYVNNNALKVIIMLTDGQGSYNTDLTKKAADNNIIIYTVGLGNSVSTSVLTAMAEGTKGSYFPASDASKLYGIFADIADDGLKDGEEIDIKKGGKKVYVKMTSNPTVKDTDKDGILDALDPEKLSYTITDRTLALIAGLSYSNLKKYEGKTIGEIIALGVEFTNLNKAYATEIQDAVLIFSNESGTGWWGNSDFKDRGLGSVAVEIKRFGKPNAIIYGLRGTELEADGLYDGLTDLILGLGPSSAQSDIAFYEYISISNSKSKEYYISGHSLGGRLTQDTLYKIYNSNEGFFGAVKTDIATPKYSATFNGLGYDRLIYIALENDIISQYKNKLHNYYFQSDMVGQSLGANPHGTYKRTGTDIEPWIAKYEDGTVITTNSAVYETSKVHGINLFHWNSNMFYPVIPVRN